jgi:multicomponent Na+:H+ antiporter subunit G
MSLVADIIAWALLFLGAGFSIVGAIGLLRFPDFYTRVHAVGVTDTMGAALILLGCGFQAGFSLISVKLAMAWLFIYLTGPAATHALAKAAFSSGLKVEVDAELGTRERDSEAEELTL